MLDALGDAFSHGELETRLTQLAEQGDTRSHVATTVERLRDLARRVYRVDYDPTSRLDERVLYPVTAVEQNGIEDARFVRFTDESGTRFYATYTAFDGTNISMQLLETADFSSFESSPLQGPAAQNKGLALFPRQINGRFAAMSRHDGSTNGVAFSTDLDHWPRATPLTSPTIVLGELPHHLLSPQLDEQDGYVPNVVYTCGAVVHEGNLVIPYGIGDFAVGFASARLDDVVGAMTVATA